MLMVEINQFNRLVLPVFFLSFFSFLLFDVAIAGKGVYVFYSSHYSQWLIFKLSTERNI